jgi:hypothetical protein
VTNFTLLGRRRSDTEAGEGTAAQEAPGHEAIDNLRLESLDWIKVNGGIDPMRVLDGAAATLWRLRPKLLVAAPDGEVLAALAARVRDTGYQPFKLETPFFNADNFNLRSIDVFEGKTSLALLAVPEETEVDVSLEHCVKL